MRPDDTEHRPEDDDPTTGRENRPEDTGEHPTSPVARMLANPRRTRRA